MIYLGNLCLCLIAKRNNNKKNNVYQCKDWQIDRLVEYIKTKCFCCVFVRLKINAATHKMLVNDKKAF